MKLFGQTRHTLVKRLHLEVAPQTDIREALQEAIQLARQFSRKHCSCRVEFRYHGVDFEVTEFSNATDLVNYFFMRQHQQSAQRRAQSAN